MINHLQSRIFRLLRDKSGNVTVELALIMLIFTILMLGGYDISRMAIQTHELEQIARSGAQYALLGQANARDGEAIIFEAKEAAGDDAEEITVTTNTFCECPDGVENDCNDTCSDGSISLMYVYVKVARPFEFLFGLPAVFGNHVIAGSAELRIR